MSSESLIAVSQILPEEVEKVTAAFKAALDKKVVLPVIFDVTGSETFTDYIMVCHGTSDRHVQAIYEGIEAALRARGMRPIGIEGENLCHWVLMDFGGLIVHIFYEPLRDFYDIEGLWVASPKLDLEEMERRGVVMGVRPEPLKTDGE
jgi:ribosome-associated protein